MIGHPRGLTPPGRRRRRCRFPAGKSARVLRRHHAPSSVSSDVAAGTVAGTPIVPPLPVTSQRLSRLRGPTTVTLVRVWGWRFGTHPGGEQLPRPRLAPSRSRLPPPPTCPPPHLRLFRLCLFPCFAPVLATLPFSGSPGARVRFFGYARRRRGWPPVAAAAAKQRPPWRAVAAARP